MKKTHIVLIVVVALVSAMLIGTYMDPSTINTFELAKQRPGKEFKFIGQYDPVHGVQYDPVANPNLYVFNMTDSTGYSQKVYLTDKDGKIQSIDALKRAESIVLYGSYNEKGEFHGHDPLPKCPSKYNQDSHSLDVAETN